MDGRSDSPCVLQDFVPFGAAAPKKEDEDDGDEQVAQGQYVVSEDKEQQGRIHGYPSRVRVGRSSAGEGH